MLHKKKALKDHFQVLVNILFKGFHKKCICFIVGCYNKSRDPGTYLCVVCEVPLFSSETKFNSGCGWPAFSDVLDQGKVKLTTDTSAGISNYFLFVCFYSFYIRIE